MQSIFKVIHIGQEQSFTRKDGTEGIKQEVILREIGGEYADSFLVTHMGQNGVAFAEGATVTASLRFRSRESIYSDSSNPQGMTTRYFQDIYLQEYVVLSSGSVPAAPSREFAIPSMPAAPSLHAAERQPQWGQHPNVRPESSEGIAQEGLTPMCESAPTVPGSVPADPF